MWRRRLAWVIACTIGVVALALGAGLAVLELSPRDYALAWRLGKTTRIEWSHPWRGSRVIELTDPSEVAEIVSAVTARLDRLPQGRMRRTPGQLRFFLEGGDQIVVGVGEGEDGHWYETSYVRFPTGPALRPYATSPGIEDVLVRMVARHPIPLGRVDIDGNEAAVAVDYYMHQWGYCCCEVYSRWVRDPSRGLSIAQGVAEMPSATFTISGRDGRSARINSIDQPKLPGESPQSHYVSIDLDELGSIDVTVRGQTTSLRIPPLRYHDPILPPCPGCGSVEVVPCVYRWPTDARPPFKGKCKLHTEAARPESPSFFCEKCQKEF